MYSAEIKPAPTRRQAPAKVSPGGTAGRWNPDDAPAQWHRVLTLLADISLFIGTRPLWAQAASHRLLVAAVVSLCYASILASGVLALVVRRGRSLARVDLVVLLTAVTLVVCGLVMNHQGSDESVLTTQAAHEFVAGHQVYGRPWPWLFGHGVALTATMNGGYDFTYGYPPLALMLTAPLLWVGHGSTAATMVGTGALIAGAVVMWRMLPVPWRSAATISCLGLGLLPTYARLGYPAILACALLIPVVLGWPRTGGGGRGDLARAACLGAACAAQQLPWFLAPFLLAGVYALRRGDLGARAAALAVGRIVGVAATTWLLINAYFIVSEPRTWFSGIALPLTQNADIHGQGLVDISLYFTDGSGRLAWYAHASLLLAAGLLALFVLFVRRLGPAATVLPWCAFYVATRSQDGYYLLMTPLWVAAAITAPWQSFRTAWQPRPAFLRGPHRRPARLAAIALLLAPSAAAVTVAATGSPPLHMRITEARRAAHELTGLTVGVTNRGASSLSPHFTVTTGQGMNRYWSVTSGPATLAGHAFGRYELRPPDGKFPLPRAGVRLRLRAVSESPMTLSSTDLHLPAAPR
ncbi:hypothetical protein ACWD4F_29160 [Streptomyces aureus]